MKAEKKTTDVVSTPRLSSFFFFFFFKANRIVNIFFFFFMSQVLFFLSQKKIYILSSFILFFCLKRGFQKKNFGDVISVKFVHTTLKGFRTEALSHHPCLLPFSCFFPYTGLVVCEIPVTARSIGNCRFVRSWFLIFSREKQRKRKKRSRSGPFQ